MADVDWTLLARYAAGECSSEEQAQEVFTVDLAKQLVAEQAAVGYDMIKLHGWTMQPEVFDSFVAAAKRLDIPFMGHAPAGGVTIERWLQSGARSTEHLTEFSSRTDTSATQIAARAAAVAQAGIWSCPTLITVNTFYGLEVDSSDWRFNKQKRAQRTYGPWIKALHDAGAGLLLGTDGPNLLGMHNPPPPGGWVSRELERLVEEAKLTPYQALETGTRNVALYFGTQDSTGTIAVGKRADLVLLNGNPLEDIRKAAHPAGVMIGGRWMSREEFARRLTALGVPKSWQ